MHVYRIEHIETKDGPYVSGERPDIDYLYTSKHPNPIYSSEWNSDVWHYVFGFKNLEQLMAWFEDELYILNECNFVCRVYEVPENHICFIDDKQIAFDSEKTQEKETIKLDSLLTNA